MITNIQLQSNVDRSCINIDLDHSCSLIYGVDLERIESGLTSWISFYQRCVLPANAYCESYKSTVTIDGYTIPNNVIIGNSGSVVPFNNRFNGVDRQMIDESLTIANVINSSDHASWIDVQSSPTFNDLWLDKLRTYYQYSYTKPFGNDVEFRSIDINNVGQVVIGVAYSDDNRPCYTSITPSVSSEISAIALLAFISAFVINHRPFVVVPSKLFDRVDCRVKLSFVYDLVNSDCQSVICTTDPSMLNTRIVDNGAVLIAKRTNKRIDVVKLVDQTNRLIRDGNNLYNLYVGNEFDR